MASIVKKCDYSREFITAVRAALSKGCKLATSADQRIVLADLLKTVRSIDDAGLPAILLLADKAVPHIFKYSDRITSRDEDFLCILDIRGECWINGVELDSSDEPIITLFENFRDIYSISEQAVRDDLYSHILQVHNAAMLFARSAWI
jgi:hypothetical protein